MIEPRPALVGVISTYTACFPPCPAYASMNSIINWRHFFQSYNQHPSDRLDPFTCAPPRAPEELFSDAAGILFSLAKRRMVRGEHFLALEAGELVGSKLGAGRTGRRLANNLSSASRAELPVANPTNPRHHHPWLRGKATYIKCRETRRRVMCRRPDDHITSWGGIPTEASGLPAIRSLPTISGASVPSRLFFAPPPPPP